MQLLVDGPDNAPNTLVLAHGAGAPMDHAFMTTVATGVAAAGFRVVRFEFPYMASRRTTGKRRGPDSKPRLLKAWRDAIMEVGDPTQLCIGGKSMGGRMASYLADELEVRGLVLLGYPFHPPGSPQKLRTEHLKELATPTLLVQGERDTFGTRDEVAEFELSPAFEICWLSDGDHSFKPRVRSGYTEAGNLDTAVAAITAFLATR